MPEPYLPEEEWEAVPADDLPDEDEPVADELMPVSIDGLAEISGGYVAGFCVPDEEDELPPAARARPRAPATNPPSTIPGKREPSF